MRFGLDSSSDESDTPLPSLPPLQRSSSSRRTPSRRSSTPITPSTTAKPFSPTPVHLLRPPTLNKSTRRGRLLPQSGDSSDEDQGASSDEDAEISEEDSDSNYDSEEDEWPVGPIGSVGINGWRRGGKGKARNQISAEQGRLLEGGPDAFQQWDDKSRADSWATANRTFHLSLSRSLRAPPLTSPSPSTYDISSLLSTLTLAQSAATSALLSSFEARNTALWSDIEASILVAEREEGERMRVLEEQRKRGEEMERKAREMREAEEKRAKEEREKEAEWKKAEGEKAEKERKENEAREAERRKKEAEEMKSASVTRPPMGSGVEGSPQAEWERWTTKMAHIKSHVLPHISTNPSLRKSCFLAKRSITPKIGQLTSSSSATLRIISQLDELLSSLRPPAGATEGGEAYTWTLNHLAKSLIKQAETEVTAKLGTAYPLGRVVVGLLVRGHEELGEVLMARLVKKCFWITGWWPTKGADQSPDAHLKLLGHAPPSAGESLTQYATRQSGLIALYASILSTSPLSPPQGPCPPQSLGLVPPHFRPAAGWRLLLLLLRPPLVGLEPTPLLVVTFLEIAGGTLLSLYGRQFGKLLECLLREGVRENKAGWSEKSRSSLVRLELWLEEWEKKGVVEVVKGGEVDP